MTRNASIFIVLPLLLLEAGLPGLRVACAGDWTKPVVVSLEEARCISYRARVSGPYLLVEASLEPGWHTFAMDNKARAEEKLAGKKSLGIERPTEIKVAGGLALAGGWLQTPPRDASKPELNWFTWIFDKQAVFAAKVRRAAGATARLTIRGQACTETSCKNIDVELPLPLDSSTRATGAAAPDVKGLVEVR
jgi:hypothetical protein